MNLENALTKIYDAAGIRIICTFADDVYDIVIDAGHGGADPGTSGNGMKESVPDPFSNAEAGNHGGEQQ